MERCVPFSWDDAIGVTDNPRLYFMEIRKGDISGEQHLYLLVRNEEIALVAAMRIGIKERVTNEAALPRTDTKFHSEILHLIIIGLGGKVSVTGDECISPVLDLT